MSNGQNMLRLLSEESFLTEQEVRETIRRQILLHESLKNPVLKLILEQEGTGVANIDSKFQDAIDMNTDEAVRLRKFSNVISAIGGTGTTAAIMALPLIPITWKLKAAAVVGIAAVAANETFKKYINS